MQKWRSRGKGRPVTIYQQECIRTGVRACNYVKIETGRKFPPVLKTVTHTVQQYKMLMLLCVHVTSVLFLEQFNNFALTTCFSWSYTLLL